MDPGISSAAYLPVKGVRFVSIDGIKPTLESISNASYPVTRYLYVVTQSYPSGATKQYIDFMRSSEGQTLLSKEGRLGQI